MTGKLDLQAEQRKVLARGGMGVLACLATLFASYLFLPIFLTLPTDTTERLVFTLRADIFVFLWVVIGVQRVSSGRYRSASDNRGSAFGPPSPAIALKVAFLQNTLEQALIAVGAHLALAANAGGPLLALVPASVVLFAVGRVTFILGYPHGAGGRAFGLVLTFVPSILLYVLALWTMLIALTGR